MREQILNTIKAIIVENFEDASCGIYHTRNILGDSMTNLYSDFRAGIKVDICYDCGYFEIFGLDYEEWKNIKEFYNSLKEEEFMS